MGWCGATDIFDSVAKVVLVQAPHDLARLTLLTLAQALEDHDWDCHQESQYDNHPIVRSIFKELHPDWQFDDDDDFG